MIRRMRKLPITVVALALVSTAFGACSSGGGNTRTIEVDYQSDEFAGAFLGYYPHTVTVTPGMTLKFHQTWTGEPHSVTFGTIADAGVKLGSPSLMQIFRDYWAGKPLPGDEPPPEYVQVFEEKLPSLFGAEEGLNQTAALPCYVEDEKSLPLDGKPCSKAQQTQPEFTGRHAYYSSGFIPFEGPRGNTFEMKIADDAKEGTYFYYCNAHGAPMGGEITIKKDADVESQAAMNRRGKAKADKDAGPVLKVLAKEKAGNGKFKGNLAGSGDDSLAGVAAFANEFTPRTINATEGEKVTWTFIGNHTISFNVPAYTPLFEFKKSKLEFNERWDKAAGGWPGPPEGHESFAGPDQEPVAIDAGEWDGSGGFHSSGTGWADGDTYSVTFTKKGTYPYACLIHPGQIGKVVVK